MDTLAKWFPSKVDWSLGLLLLLAPAVSLIATLAAPETQRVAWLIVTAVLATVCLGFAYPLSYGFTDSELIVRHRFVRQRIKLERITEVTLARNSLDRVRLTFDSGRSVEIWPAAKAEFLVELALRARLVRKGDGLARLS